MLKKIPKCISPEVMKFLMEMGHSDVVIIADANFPSHSNAQRIVRLDSAEITELLSAILEFFPLDNFIKNPVVLMKNREEEEVPENWKKYKEIIRNLDEENAFTDFDFIERLDFYDFAKSAYLIIQTGDTARYGNIALQKGVC